MRVQPNSPTADRNPNSKPAQGPVSDPWGDTAGLNFLTGGLYGTAKTVSDVSQGKATLGELGGTALGGIGPAASITPYVGKEIDAVAPQIDLGLTNNYHAGIAPLDMSAYNYGGDPNRANNDANGYINQAHQINQRPGVQVDQSLSANDWGNYQRDRSGQGNLLAQYQAIANGGGNSLAQQQLRAAGDQNIQQQMALANSARGGGLGYAAAQDAAMHGVSAVGQQIAGQSAMLRAQEQQAALAGMGNTLNSMQGGDLSSRGMSNQMALGQAGFDMGQRQLNDQTGLGYNQLATGILGTQLNAGMQGQAQASNNYNQAAGINAGVAQGNAANRAAVTGGILNAAGGVLGAMIPAFGAAKAVGAVAGGGAPPAPAPTLGAPAPVNGGVMQNATYGQPYKPY